MTITDQDHEVSELFDFTEHEARADAAAEALAEANHAEAEADAAAEAAADRLAEIEAKLGSGKITASAVTKARAEHEIAQAVAKQASSRVLAVRRAIPNTDHRIADAIAPAVRSILHSAVHVVSVPAELQVTPTLEDYRPVVAIVQTGPGYSSPEGWLASNEPARTRGQGEHAVKIMFHGVHGLHQTLTPANVWEALWREGIGLYEQRPNDLVARTRTYTSPATKEQIIEQVITVHVTSAYPEVPIVTVDPNPSYLGPVVESAVRRGFGRLQVDGSVEAQSAVEAGDGWEITFNLSATADPNVIYQRLGSWLDTLAGRAVATLGRVRAVELVTAGEPHLGGRYHGFKGARVRLAFAVDHDCQADAT